MTQIENLKSKYLQRFDELIAQGEDIYKGIKTEHKTIPNSYWAENGSNVVKTTHYINWPIFVEWRTKAATLLSNVVPITNVHYETVHKFFPEIKNKKDHLEYGIALLKAIKEDFENEMISSIADQLEAANLVDYMNMAEQLLEEGIPNKFDHVPAVVLAGAILEKSLRDLCHKSNPPIPTIKNENEPYRLNYLIDALKKEGIFNELIAKQLRAWADIRNNAAHGDFEKFKKDDVDLMIKGINSFLANYVK